MLHSNVVFRVIKIDVCVFECWAYRAEIEVILNV